MSGFDYIQQAKAAKAPAQPPRPAPRTAEETQALIDEGNKRLLEWLDMREGGAARLSPIEHTNASRTADERTDSILNRAAANGANIAAGGKIALSPAPAPGRNGKLNMPAPRNI